MNAINPTPELSGRQLRVADALAEGASQREVARSLGINRKTIAAWMSKPAFRARVQVLLRKRRGAERVAGRGADEFRRTMATTNRTCEHCNQTIPASARADARYCGEAHRKAAADRRRRAQTGAETAAYPGAETAERPVQTGVSALLGIAKSKSARGRDRISACRELIARGQQREAALQALDEVIASPTTADQDLIAAVRARRRALPAESGPEVGTAHFGPESYYEYPDGTRAPFEFDWETFMSWQDHHLEHGHSYGHLTGSVRGKAS
jgi:hypothetical protein